MAKFWVLMVVVLVVMGQGIGNGWGEKTGEEEAWIIHTLFSGECNNYFDWQTVGLVHSFRKARQPGLITRLLSCTEEEKKNYRGMHLAPTLEVPSMSRHPRTGDWYPAINKPAGVVHWLEHSKDAENVDWVVILDADMIMRGPFIPWKLGAEKGRPVAAYYGYLVGCDNILAKIHTKHPELCDKVSGPVAIHIDDLRVLAPIWLSKTEEVREDKAHWATNITGDVYGEGWISEMYGYSFGAAEVGLHHKINENLMLFPSYIPLEGIEPIILHYELPFEVGNWSFDKTSNHEYDFVDDFVYDCGRLFPEPPYPKEVQLMESDPNKRRAHFLSIECINILNEGLILQHKANGCPNPQMSKYVSFLKSRTFADMTRPKYPTPATLQMKEDKLQQQVYERTEKPDLKIHTVFSTECTTYFDWQTVGLIHSFHQSGQPGNITRLLSCTDEDLKKYKGHDLAPTHYVPSMSRHPLTGDWYPAINKPAAVLHWLNHATIDADFIVILDADMIMRGSITPWEFKAARGRPVSTPYEYLIGCDNVLAKLHTRHPEACEKVGGIIIMHIDDLRKFAILWLHKTEEVRADKAHYATNISGDIYESGWISEMYGYTFGAAELELRHVISREILIYPGYVPLPGVNYRVLHYGLEFKIGNWRFDKAQWRDVDIVNTCWAKFPSPPNASSLDQKDESERQKNLLSIECVKKLNQALHLHHLRRKCSDPSSMTISTSDTGNNSTVFRKFGKFDKRKAEEDDNAARDTTLSSLRIRKAEVDDNTARDTTLSSLRIWLIALWALSGVGILAFILMKFAVHKGRGARGRSKRKVSYSGLDIDGRDRLIREVN